ncbi:MAG: hypothetical protein ACJ76F_06520, partial [Bacteroidia bacterium]
GSSRKHVFCCSPFRMWRNTLTFHYSIMRRSHLWILLSVILPVAEACKDNSSDKRSGSHRFYYLRYNMSAQPSPDTVFINSLNRNVSDFQNIFTAEFKEAGKPVYKFINSAPPAENRTMYYYTEDFGIIYSKNITRKSYSRLHSNNDSTDKAIGEYIDRILSNQNLVAAGEEYIVLGDTIIRLNEPENCE